ncbi:unnamed protein product [Peronospora belbahrii]|uniref:Minichromosome loss protein Mcl1 middle region domain-containing protein n=1 Tax=Peronospora belbahrii TaxID=622444 RepID=A0AAU9KQC8_9STRA|nr:unnamed protein product [Peronospora belbahrii]
MKKKFSTPSFLSPIPASATSRSKCPTTTNIMHHQAHATKKRGKGFRALDDISNKHSVDGSYPEFTRKLVFTTPYKTPLLQTRTISETSDTRNQKTPLQRRSSSFASSSFKLQYPVSSTVSSVAVAWNPPSLVVGFYNGMIVLYPLDQERAIQYPRGILLDQIMPRGIYTQLMVTVSIPENGKLIFAGVYRGSTAIRAYEVDSIVLPVSRRQETVEIISTRNKAARMAIETQESGEMFAASSLESLGGPVVGHVVSHIYSDAKLKGFATVKSFECKKTNTTEYRLLCGIGIKNVHMWRFYQKKKKKTMTTVVVNNTRDVEWTWECIFDKQTNGISVEFLAFHPTSWNQFISKSEHQNVRIWYLEEEYHDFDESVTIRKKSHVDVKHTLDTVAVYGDYAYGGSESFAIIDLQAATRMDLDLPLSAKEQHAHHEAVFNSRNTASLRAWNPRGKRRRGAEDTSGQRHMRTVSKIAGQNGSPFTVGMCSDGSVFCHQPRKDIGIATPLDYVEGYEQFFVDPSLNFQAQFSDLTRVNTSGLLAVFPLPETEKEEWLIVAANQDQLLVQSLETFLRRNQQKKEYSEVKVDYADLSGAESNTDECSSDSNDTDERVRKEKHQYEKKQDKAILKRSRQEKTLKSQETGRKIKRNRHGAEKTMSRAKVSGMSGERRKLLSCSKPGSQKKLVKTKQLGVADDEEEGNDSIAGVTTPKCSTNCNDGKLSTSTASPVVSISSWSGSSNPNTPEQLGRSRVERQLMALRKLEWASPNVAAAKSQLDNEQKSTDSAVDTAAVLAPLSPKSNEVKTKTKTLLSGKKTLRRMKVQALFANNESTKECGKEENQEVARTETKKNAEGGRAGSNESARVQAENQDAMPRDPDKPTEADNHMEQVQPTEKEDADLEEELEQLKQYEPEFVSVPFAGDGGSLVAATMYQYGDPATTDIKMANADDNVKADCVAATTEQTNLLLHFSHQNERLKMNFLTERARIYKHLDCRCVSHVCSKKSSSTCTGGVNWRQNVAHDYHKRKQSKRRHKKQLAAKLHQLHTSYAVQIQELSAMQHMQATAFRARQQFQHLHKQFCRQGASSTLDKTFSSLSSGTSAASPLKHSILPDHVSEMSFPYRDLFS